MTLRQELREASDAVRKRYEEEARRIAERTNASMIEQRKALCDQIADICREAAAQGLYEVVVLESKEYKKEEVKYSDLRMYDKVVFDRIQVSGLDPELRTVAMHYGDEIVAHVEFVAKW